MGKTVASVGQDVKVTCKLSAPTDKVQWLKSGRFLVDEKSNFTKYSVESSSPAEQVCKKGQDMNFKVNLAANQLKEPTVKWMFNGKEIKSSERIVTSFSRTQVCMTIRQ